MKTIVEILDELAVNGGYKDFRDIITKISHLPFTPSFRSVTILIEQAAEIYANLKKKSFLRGSSDKMNDLDFIKTYLDEHLPKDS